MPHKRIFIVFIAAIVVSNTLFAQAQDAPQPTTTDAADEQAEPLQAASKKREQELEERRMDCPAAESLRIGSWRVDPALNEISREGQTIRLEARAMSLLLRLARRPGEVVSVDDLLTDVWSGVVVTA